MTGRGPAPISRHRSKRPQPHNQLTDSTESVRIHGRSTPLGKPSGVDRLLCEPLSACDRDFGLDSNRVAGASHRNCSAEMTDHRPRHLGRPGAGLVRKRSFTRARYLEMNCVATVAHNYRGVGDSGRVGNLPPDLTADHPQLPQVARRHSLGAGEGKDHRSGYQVPLRPGG